MIVIWISDGSGRHSCHLNNGATFEASYLGHITCKNNNISEWFAVLKGDTTEHGPFGYWGAKKFVMDKVGGEQL